MKTKSKIIAGVATLAIGVGSSLGVTVRNANLAENFAKQNKLITGTVLTESYQNTLVPNPKYNGVVSYSNETVKLDYKYTLKIKTDDERIIGVSIINSYPYGAATKESLDVLIESAEEVGIDNASRISFPRGNMRAKNFLSGSAHNYDKKETSFQENIQMVTKRAYRVKVLIK